MKLHGAVVLFALACGGLAAPDSVESTSRSGERLAGVGFGGGGTGGASAHVVSTLSVGSAGAPGPCATGQPRTLTLFDDSLNYDGERDTFLGKGAPNTNFSYFASLFVTGDPPGGAAGGNSMGGTTGAEQVALLRWDLTNGSVSSADTVCTAAIQLYVTDPANGYGVYPVKRPWVFNEATWNSASTSNPWEVPGAQGVSDRGALVANLGAGTVNATTTVRIPASLAQTWINDPTHNYGVLIANHWDSDRLLVTSHNGPTYVNRPTLVLTIVGP